jgi:SpoVK/Ycf46/Vps4 family AAA+-type ATPase
VVVEGLEVWAPASAPTLPGTASAAELLTELDQLRRRGRWFVVGTARAPAGVDARVRRWFVDEWVVPPPPPAAHGAAAALLLRLAGDGGTPDSLVSTARRLAAAKGLLLADTAALCRDAHAGAAARGAVGPAVADLVAAAARLQPTNVLGICGAMQPGEVPGLPWEAVAGLEGVKETLQRLLVCHPGRCAGACPLLSTAC